MQSNFEHDFGLFDNLLPSKRGFKIDNLNINSLLSFRN
jgi:hypothetical protein